MKSLAITSFTAAVLAAAVSASGFALDAAALLSIAFAAGIAGMFVTDYRRKPDYRTEAVQAPVRRATRRAPAAPEFAAGIIFNTTCA